ncbi:hypothetical protein M1N79_03480 [Dehalococcoidia bacterium]|nr:hypothetical protein [Dehalococcoidia bacterium]
MIKYKKVTKTTEEISSVKCDKCGKEYDVDDVFEVQEFHYISFWGGYGSIFGDGTKVECDICQHCLHEMISSFCRCSDGSG